MRFSKEYQERRHDEMMADPNDRSHGTLTGYNTYKCRCDRCRSAKAADNRKKRRFLSDSVAAAEEEASRKEGIAVKETVDSMMGDRNHTMPEEPKPQPNPVRVAKHNAAVKARRAKQPKDVCTLNELDKRNMAGPSIRFEPPRCAVCGRTWSVEEHHIVKRSAGEWVRNGREMPKPTVMLCGRGNNLKDADGRYYCHGRAEHRMLHFRWVPSEYFGEGHWEYLVTKVPMKYHIALTLGGWRELKGGE